MSVIIALLLVGLLFHDQIKMSDTAPAAAQESNSKMPTEAPVQAGFAGSFYTGNANALRAEVKGYIDAAPIRQDLDGWAWISPHAGFVYSGPIAGHVYRQLAARQPSRVVVIAFTHRPYSTDGAMRGGAVATITAPSFLTPLGALPVDVTEVQALLAEAPFIREDRTIFAGEHSLEVQLPFIQVAAPKALLVPLMFGNQDDPALMGKLAAIIAKRYASDPNTVVIASTDMSHYFPYDKAVAIDQRALKAVIDLDPGTLAGLAPLRQAEFCGLAPVLTLLLAQKTIQGQAPVVLDYRNSGDTAGDKGRVVGYSAVLFPRPTGLTKPTQAITNEHEMKNKDTEFSLTNQQKVHLLSIARQTVETLVRTGKVPDFSETDPILLAPGAAFVTLKKNGDLRGCIGHTEPYLPLWRCVREMAKAASTLDTRFRPVAPEELADLDYEISVLFPAVPVRDVNEIVVGRDGLTIELHGRRGLLLPQVPIEWGWNREEFLNQTARKAGLPTDAWKDSAAVIQRFQGIIFSENEVQQQ
jgi:AmmeMemoRadiSam system protein B/AmmeMemoRadiSam system protein A